MNEFNVEKIVLFWEPFFDVERIDNELVRCHTLSVNKSHIAGAAMVDNQ